MNALVNWVEDRTGLVTFLRAALYENIPGGSRWRYVWGATLAFAFFVQVVTGVFLWMVYSPSGHTAWESVYFIQHEMTGGWFLRGLHHYTSHAMIVLMALHLMQVVIDGAYRAPREFNFWIGLVLMLLVFGLALSGYLLPWDQKGFWASQVATNLLGVVPWIGNTLREMTVGGSEYGHHTLTRFFALHAGVLPGLLIFLLVAHVYLFRRHGITVKEPKRGHDQMFWPDQLLKDAVACLAVLAVVLGLLLWPAALGDHQGARPGDYLGADLGAPADPTTPYSAARPEWYYLFLFQFLKYFPGEAEVYAAVVAPAGVFAVMILMPFIGRWKLGRGFNIGFLSALFAGIALLTVLAVYEDRSDANFRQAVVEAKDEARRAVVLSRLEGIPAAGAVALLRKDPKTQGPKLFARYCATCHLHQDPKTVDEKELPDLPGGPNLHGFAGRDWLRGILDPEQVAGANYFGRTEHADGEMVDFVQTTVGELDEEGRAALGKVIVALSAQADLPAQRESQPANVETIAEGEQLLKEHFWNDESACTDCHRFGDAGELGAAPDLSGYGSREWLVGMISNPEHERYYGETNDRMPVFGSSDGKSGILDRRQIEMVADWLRGDWLEPVEEVPTSDDPRIVSRPSAGGSDGSSGTED